MNKYIVEALKRGRKVKGLRQVDVATAIGVSDVTIGNYEKGISEPRLDDLAKIFALYDMSFSEVIRIAYESGITKHSAFVKEMKDEAKMITITKEKWDSICSDYKGEWQNYHDDHPEWIGRKVLMSGCVTENPAELGKLLIEGVHFVIEEMSNKKS